MDVNSLFDGKFLVPKDKDEFPLLMVMEDGETSFDTLMLTLSIFHSHIRLLCLPKYSLYQRQDGCWRP